MIRRITDYLEDIAGFHPDKIAYSDENSGISFKELRKDAMRVAEALIREDFFRKPVLIYMEKTVSCVTAFLGTAYSGNFYTPLDPSSPKNRTEKIIETLNPVAVITLREHSDEIKGMEKGGKILVLEDLLSLECDEEAVIKKSKSVIDTDILYIIFTSGSTGIPKGVCIPHRAVIDYIEWFTNKFDIDEKTVFGNQVPVYFDFSIQDIFSPLKTGCTTHLIHPKHFGFPGSLMKLLYEKKVNTIAWVPTALCLTANMKGLKIDNLPELKKIFFAGEVMPRKQLSMWQKAYPDAIFANLYGPTEAANIVTWYIIERELEENEPVPMGAPCENIDILILDDNDKQVKEGEVGELCVRGTCLANGYYNNTEKTAEVFIQNPLNGDYPERIYRTGDLVKINGYGELVYVSRKDFQIKHMGYRIELGEIETAASSLEGVDLNCCVYDDKHSQIVLFYEGDAEEQSIRSELEHHIPEYMIPGSVIKLSEMPKNANGKMDRALLKQKAAE